MRNKALEGWENASLNEWAERVTREAVQKMCEGPALDCEQAIDPDSVKERTVNYGRFLPVQKRMLCGPCDEIVQAIAVDARMRSFE
jgi:hypothetical protein